MLAGVRINHRDPSQLGRLIPGHDLWRALHPPIRKVNALRDDGASGHCAADDYGSAADLRAKYCPRAFNSSSPLGQGRDCSTAALVLVANQRWCEIVAMVSSFVISIGFFIAKRGGVKIPDHVAPVGDGRGHYHCVGHYRFICATRESRHLACASTGRCARRAWLGIRSVARRSWNRPHSLPQGRSGVDTGLSRRVYGALFRHRLVVLWPHRYGTF